MHPTGPQQGHVLVVGGGISGLAAAHRLLAAGVRVTVLEASGRVGGKILAGEIAGARVDLGAESMLARRPEALALAREVGLAGSLRPPSTATASLWTRGALRPMPKGHVMGVPAEASALAGVVSEEGLRRIERDLELPPTGTGEDISVGAYVAARMGREVVDRLVEPLLGGVYASDAHRISLRAAIPQLFAAAQEHRSLTEAVRSLQERAAAQGQTGPVFMGIEGGIGQLPVAVAESVRSRGGRILTDTPVTELRRTPEGWRAVTPEEIFEAEAVILAVPAPQASRLLKAEAPGASAELGTFEYASMALTAMAFRREEVRLPRGSGFLVPPVDGRTIKAATFASRKWGWIDQENPGLHLVRTSVGRHGEQRILESEDSEIIGLSLHDLREAVGITARPVAARVIRWDEGLPQYSVGHLARVARIREHAGRLPGLALCGAAYDGVGIPACVAGADTAAARVLAALGGRSGGDPRTSTVAGEGE